MKSISQIASRALVNRLMLAAASVSLLGAAQANQCECMHAEVKVLHYYGSEGRDDDGNKLYGVKIQRGNQFYFAELQKSMPTLRFHTNKRILVTVCRDSKQWRNVTLNNDTTSIYRVTRLPNRHWQPEGWCGIFSDFFKPTSPPIASRSPKTPRPVRAPIPSAPEPAPVDSSSPFYYD